jgi:DNA repair exonuclease SbcCD nuclease subunit
MRVLHAADLHIDSPMKGLVAYDEAPVGELRLATRAALANLVDAAIEHEVEAVLLSGDIFDGDWPHYGTGVYFVREMGRLREAHIPVVTIAGNHDAESKLTKSLRLPDNVRTLSTRKPDSVSFEAIGLAVHGQGYATPAVTDDLSAGYPEPIADFVNVGLLHTCADGRPGHEPYAPCTTSDLVSHGYDFWGLGHVHRHEILSTDPLILFPGNLQGRGLRETGAKGAVLVELGRDGSASFSHLALDTVRWALLDVDASEAHGRDDVLESVAVALREAIRNAGDRLLAARVAISGVTEAHTALASDGERLRYEVIAAAADLGGGRVWIESVKLGTSPQQELAHGGDDAVGELVQELEELTSDEASTGELAAVLGHLVGVLPPAVLEEFDPSDAETIRELMADVSRTLPVALLERTET